MCGIAGVVSRSGAGEIFKTLQTAARLLEHRGPDDEGYLVYDAASRTVDDRLSPPRAVPAFEGAGAAAGSAGLAHRRLSIIELSPCGRQPMTLPGSGLHVVLNGEIYNYLELRTELQAAGRQFATASDTEVLLAAYAQWGPAALLRLEGMFAFAILDLPQDKLFLARDFFGIKPLFYSTSQTGFCFASEISALLSMPNVGRRANPRRVFEHLNYWTTDQGDDTFFADIHKLPPAHYMEVPLDAPEKAAPVRYWDLARSQILDLSLGAAAERLQELFLESVKLHLRSDVPVAVALSGGPDSSAIVMAARRLLGASAELNTVSYIASEPKLCEEPWIDSVNQAAGARPHKVNVEDRDLGSDFEKLVALQGQPVVTPVVYAQHRVFRKAHECGFKVLLEGQGADELLAGYSFYQPARLATLLSRGEWRRALRFLRAAPAHSQTTASWVLRHALKRYLPAGMVHALQGLKPGPRMAPWISRSWAERNGVEHGAAPSEALAPASGNYLRDMMYDTAFATKLPGLLRYGDHNAMSVSVENRVPFLTPRLAEFVFSLPEEYLVSPAGTGKAVFREAMQGMIPEGVRLRSKLGFEPPYQAWMNGMRGKAVDTLRSAGELEILDQPAVEAFADRIAREGVTSDTSANQLWRLVCLVQWARHFHVAFD